MMQNTKGFPRGCRTSAGLTTLPSARVTSIPSLRSCRCGPTGTPNALTLFMSIFAMGACTITV